MHIYGYTFKCIENMYLKLAKELCYIDTRNRLHVCKYKVLSMNVTDASSNKFFLKKPSV